MMLNRDDLYMLLRMLDEEATNCPKHGAESMEICSECREIWSISCGVCQVIGCQCMNDD